MIDCNFKCASNDCANTEIICMKIDNWIEIALNYQARRNKQTDTQHVVNTYVYVCVTICDRLYPAGVQIELLQNEVNYDF